MTSYAELLAVCTEFKENFASLTGKYNAAMEEVQSAKEANERMSKQLEVMRGNEEKLHNTIRELKRDISEANVYKDRYLAANVTVEHLKGRLENARHAVADKMLEHEQQVEQLRGQIKDLLQRVSVCTDAQTTQQLRRQVVELEERCAEQSGQLLEEKERCSQQLLAAHTALREQQSRNLELEQRCRALETEVTQMRSVVRRSADLQNDAAVAREKSASEARRAAMQMESLEKELCDLQEKLSVATEQHTEELEAVRAAAEEEKSQLLERVSQLSAAVDDAAASRTAEQERYAALQRSVHDRVEAVRADARLELTVLQKSLSDVRAENQQLSWRVEQMQMELVESRRTLQQREAKIESCAAECKELRTQVDSLRQREAWLSAERDHQLAQLAAASRQAQELAVVRRAHEESDLTGERLRIQLQFLEGELQEARRLSEGYDSHVRDIEEAAERRLRALRSEIKVIKKQARVERTKADTVRRRLVRALLERQADVSPQIYQQLTPATALTAEPQRPAAGLDVLALLRGQSEQAEALHHRLVELSSGLPQKAKALRQMLYSKDLSFLMEAHNGLSARIVEETGFRGIWGSGLSISAQMGLRDNNEASWTQVCDVAEQMSDAADIPILLDADTGFGNFNNARFLVRKLEKIGVAGACVEDKLFPKTNSLLDERGAQPLADVKEFALKIRAMKDTQTDENFCVVARVESFIAGWPLEEALRRATAYAEAGADAVLIHSKKKDSSDIDAFMAHWDRKVPVVIVPTSYAGVPCSHFRDIGISTVIWANHNLRSCITAMQAATKKIYEQESVVGLEKDIAPVKEVFRLQRLPEYLTAEDAYLPKQ